MEGGWKVVKLAELWRGSGSTCLGILFHFLVKQEYIGLLLLGPFSFLVVYEKLTESMPI